MKELRYIGEQKFIESRYMTVDSILVYFILPVIKHDKAVMANG